MIVIVLTTYIVYVVLCKALELIIAQGNNLKQQGYMRALALLFVSFDCISFHSYFV
jgi:hypothetical protein